MSSAVEPFNDDEFFEVYGPEECAQCRNEDIEIFEPAGALKTSSKCGHSFCIFCIEKAFAAGISFCCGVCGHAVYKRDLLEYASSFASEVGQRRKLAETFNKRPDDFPSEAAFNDYLEWVEALTGRLLRPGHDPDRAEAQAELERYKLANRASISQRAAEAAAAEEAALALEAAAVASSAAAVTSRLAVAAAERSARAAAKRQRQDALLVDGAAVSLAPLEAGAAASSAQLPGPHAPASLPPLVPFWRLQLGPPPRPLTVAQQSAAQATAATPAAAKLRADQRRAACGYDPLVCRRRAWLEAVSSLLAPAAPSVVT